MSKKVTERLIFGPWYPDEVKWHCDRHSLFLLPIPTKIQTWLCWYYVISEMSPNIVSNPEKSTFSVHAEKKKGWPNIRANRNSVWERFLFAPGGQAWLISKAPADRCGTKQIWSYWLPMHSYTILEGTYTWGLSWVLCLFRCRTSWWPHQTGDVSDAHARRESNERRKETVLVAVHAQMCRCALLHVYHFISNGEKKLRCMQCPSCAVS